MAVSTRSSPTDVSTKHRDTCAFGPEIRSVLGCGGVEVHHRSACQPAQVRITLTFGPSSPPAAPCYAPAMARPKRPADFAQRAKLIVDMTKAPIPA